MREKRMIGKFQDMTMKDQQVNHQQKVKTKISAAIHPRCCAVTPKRPTRMATIQEQSNPRGKIDQFGLLGGGRRCAVGGKVLKCHCKFCMVMICCKNGAITRPESRIPTEKLCSIDLRRNYDSGKYKSHQEIFETRYAPLISSTREAWMCFPCSRKGWRWNILVFSKRSGSQSDPLFSKTRLKY